MIEKITPCEEVISRLAMYSHGAVTSDEIKRMLEKKEAMVIVANSRLATGIMWDKESIGYFGFHGEMMQKDLEDIFEFTTDLAKRLGLTKVRFLSPRSAWNRLLKNFGFRQVVIVYEKEL